MTGVKKELRTLAWPAAAVLAATVVPLLWLMAGATGGTRGWPLQAALTAFVVGTAVLVALPFGAEFQQRTLALVLSQPLGRARVWLEKWGVLLAVLTVLAAVQFAAAGAAGDGRVGVREGTFVLALACSGFLWTLVAGSTIGGAAFSLAALAIVEMTSSFVTSRLTGLDLNPFATHPALVGVRLAYSVVTLWLGWRLFAKFELQAQGESTGVVPMALLEAIPALRCRPTGALANLVRKELRLHQPTVLIAALFALCWLGAMLLFSMTPDRPVAADVVFTTLFISYVPLVLVVCGTISIGEETTLGIRAWSLTLPVSSMTQWAVKLAVVLLVGGALGFALPVALKQLTPVLVSLPAGTIQLPSAARMAAATGALLVISFWSGTLFGHTVKAAVATGVAVLSLWVCIVFASLAGQRMGIGSGWLTSLMVANQWSPDDLLLLDTRRLPGLVVLVSMGVVALLTLRQSLVAFRAPQVDRGRIVRYALQLLVATAILSFIPNAYLRAAYDQYRSQPMRELEIALQQVSAASLAATGDVPGSVTAAELDATGQLSADARRWLAGSRISLRPSVPRRQAEQQVMYVLTDVRFPSGSGFRTFYRMPPAR
jgi:hypothetical protein